MLLSSKEIYDIENLCCLGEEYFIRREINERKVVLRVEFVYANFYQIWDLTYTLNKKNYVIDDELNVNFSMTPYHHSIDVYDTAAVVSREIEKILDGYGKGRGITGRRAKGLTRKVSITMHEDDWTLIDNLIKAGEYESRSDYFRKLHLTQRHRIHSHD